MTHQIKNNRQEADTMAAQIYLDQNKELAMMDYIDIVTLRKYSTLKYSFSCQLENNSEIKENFARVLESNELPLAECDCFIVGIYANQSTPMEIDGCLDVINSIALCNGTDSPLNGIWTYANDNNLAPNQCRIAVTLGTPKSEAERADDPMYDQLMSDYIDAHLAK